MAYTGFQFKLNFDRRIDKSFSDYYNPNQEKEFYKRLVQKAIDSKYEILSKQKRFDELRGVLGANKKVDFTSGATVYLQPIALTGYDFTAGTIQSAYPINASVGDIIEVSITGSAGTLNLSLPITVINNLTVTVTGLTDVGTFLSGNVKTSQILLDYMYLFSVRVAYNLPITNVEFEGFEVTIAYVNVIFNKRVKYRDGDDIIISNVLGTTNANGLRYLKQIGQKKYRLYADKDLTIPILGNNTYISGGAITEPYLSKPIFQLKPDQINYDSEPTFQYPRFRIDTNSITLEPKENIVYALFDYMTLPKIDIDPEDNETDLLLYYPISMLEYFIDYGATLFDVETRNAPGLNMDASPIIMNP